jgi:putative sterol carrier protein
MAKLTYEKIFADVKKSLMKADVSKLPREFAIQCNITGEGEGSFYVAFKEGIFSVEPYDYKDNDAYLTADGDTFMKMFSKKITGFEAHDQGKLAFGGDLDAVLTLGGLEPKPTAVANAKKKSKSKPAAKKAEPAKKAEEPVKKAEEPAKKADEPVKKAEEPAKKADEPAKKAEEPAKKD